MIEAVNSVLSNAPLLRNNAEQAAALRPTPAATGSSRQELGTPVAPYISPYIYVNNQYNKAVLQIRDSDTGDVLNEFPSESALQARARAEQLQAQQASRSPSQTSLSEEREISVNNSPRSFSGSIQLDSSTFNVVQFSQPTPDVNISPPSPSPLPQPRVAEAQVASAALSAGASSGQTVPSSVSVIA